MNPGELRSACTILTAVGILGQAYMRAVDSTPATLYGEGREVTSQPSCESDCNWPSGAAPNLMWCRVSARNVAMVKPWSRVGTSFKGRPTRLATRAIQWVRGFGPLEPKAPPM